MHNMLVLGVYFKYKAIIYIELTPLNHHTMHYPNLQKLKRFILPGHLFENKTNQRLANYCHPLPIYSNFYTPEHNDITTQYQDKKKH